MGNFEDRVTEIVRTVVDPEIRTVWDTFLERPEDNKAALQSILEKLNSIADWMPRVKSEVKDIQDTLRANSKKEEKKETNNPERSERIRRKLEKMKDLLKKYADRLADDLLPDSLQKWLQPLTGDDWMRDYGDNGVDIIENMIDNTLTNIPLIIAIRTAIEALTTRIAAMDAILKHGISEVNKKLGDVETQYLQSMKETIERVEMLQDADHNTIMHIDRGIDNLQDQASSNYRSLSDQIDQRAQSILDQLNQCCEDMGDQLGSIADTLSQCCQNMSQAIGNLSQSLTNIDNHLSNSTDSLSQSISSLNDQLNTIDTHLSDSAEDLSQSITDLADQLGDNTQGIMSGINDVDTHLSDSTEDLSQSITDLSDQLGDNTREIMSGINDVKENSSQLMSCIANSAIRGLA